MKVWLTIRRNKNSQIENNWCYKTIKHCLNMTKLTHGMQWWCIISKGQCYWEKQWIVTFTFWSLWCVILGITVHNLGIEANYTYLPELMHTPSWGILKIQITWKLHILCKNWKTLSEQKLIIFSDEISTMYHEIFPKFARPA